ncbi:uncharacterized protein LOC132194259 [Neocloeon triangulifer]|uniref:uncharacterized protein LOC132194259 n=1 Tax=Neocloeon triangulifer TaxID=2078957 RepID=UPI00286F08D2|nr:uncharacterized protein LOC132194259 [Neocloeon triangulifer]XP_059471410.1 uncharacterized protein LOC132194259 [Neocloeon triangulifer]XP_059471411.1 uncharacterized protein LOC132194259 [Neocloeon triangulifer]
MPPQQGATGNQSQPVSNKKIRAFNADVFIWRLTEHDGKSSWTHQELQALYTKEVEPFGYKFPYRRMLLELCYKKFAYVSQLEGNVEIVHVIHGNIWKYIKQVNPEKPPVVQRSPQNKDVKQTTLKFVKFLATNGLCFGTCAVRESKLSERFQLIFPTSTSYSKVLEHMVKSGLMKRKGEDMYLFDATRTRAYLQQSKDITTKVAANGVAAGGMKHSQPIATAHSNGKDEVEDTAHAFLKYLSNWGVESASPISEEKLREKFMAGIKNSSEQLYTFVLAYLLANKIAEHFGSTRIKFNKQRVRNIVDQQQPPQQKPILAAPVLRLPIIQKPILAPPFSQQQPQQKPLLTQPVQYPPSNQLVPSQPNGTSFNGFTNFQASRQQQKTGRQRFNNAQKGMSRTVANLMRDNGLLPGSKRFEWSVVTGEYVNDNRKTFIDQRRAFSVGNLFNQPEIYYPQDMDYCSECASSFANSEDLENHLDTDMHKFMTIYSKTRGKSDGAGLPDELSGKRQSIVIQSSAENEGRETLSFHIVLESEEPLKRDIYLELLYHPSEESGLNCHLLETFYVVGDEDILSVDEKSAIVLEKGVPSMKSFVLDCIYPGFLEYVIAFKFCFINEEGDLVEEFFVMKKMNIKIGYSYTEETSEISGTPRRQKFHMVDEEDYNIIEPPLIEEAEFPPLPRSSLKVVHRLEDYPLPWRHISYFNYGFNIGPDPWLETLKKKLKILECLLGGAVVNNYTPFFKLLLFLEEHQILCDLRKYALEDATLQHIGTSRNFYLQVPGLAENRPSVLVCDAIYITTSLGVYKGFVNLVEQHRIRFGMGPSFVQDFHPDLKVSVHFSFNRTCLKVQHRALELMRDTQQLPQTLFPRTCESFKEEINIIDWFNTRISQNPMQRQAVQNIVNGTSMPAPYLIFGPPGTGKTVTLVEAMKQVYLLKSGSHILAVAPSNWAADLLALKLLESVPASKLIRLYSPSVKYSKVPQKLRPVSNYQDESCHFPALNYLLQFRVVVMTMISAGRLYSGNFQPGHFTHIFIDECGHGMEPSALVPIAGLQGYRHRPSQIVISGDPKQLGPIVHSPVAIAMGLGDSLLVRLMDSVDLYQKTEGSYNASVLTKLTYNYRSHPQILKVPNDLFYEGELLPCGDIKKIASACGLTWLPNSEFPLVFHGINGRDEQSPQSPSYFNVAEVHEVVKYVKKIMASEFNGVMLSQNEIGVVSPYRGQLNKLNRALACAGFPDVCVGSVEEFQGQERRVIIISTVRSNPAQLKLDHKFNLGFVREPRRFNVAVTRASALLIIVGNPHLLQTDKNWRALLEHIYIHGGYTHTNCPFKLGPPVQVDFRAPDENLSAIRGKLEQLQQKLKDKISEMESAGDDGTSNAVPKNEDSYVEELLVQIRKLNFFTEDGPAGYPGD